MGGIALSKSAKIQSFYSHGEEFIEVEFHTIEVHPEKFQGYLRVLTPEGDFNFILDSIEDEKLELLYQSLERTLTKVSNLLEPKEDDQ
jgi:hypothetical protein